MYDYLIVGHGLAGALLSHELIKRRKEVFVIDGEKENVASKVAAGIYNPITGRKMGKTWMADQLFPMLPGFYTELEQELSTKFLYDIGIYRPFFSIEQQNDWNAKPKEGLEDMVDHISNQKHSSGMFNDEHGGLYLKNAGYVDTNELIGAHKNFLVDKGCYRKGVFNKSQLETEKNTLSFDNIKFKRLVFCLGIGQQLSPYFDSLPFRPVKGEILDCKLDVNVETIVNRGVFMVPKGNNVYRVGATYDWRNLSEETTQSGKSELLNKMETLFSGRYEVLNAKAGIRPATKDRKPFIGQHPEDERICIFNGFGSKGVSMIPYFSKKFADSLESEENMEKEVNVNRYF